MLDPPVSLSLRQAMTAWVKARAIALGFDLVGIARPNAAGQPDDCTTPALQAWLERGYQAEMAWMGDRRRQDVRRVLPPEMPEVRSLVCLGLNYYTPPQHSTEPGRAKLSRYGWGRDYHRVLGKRLKALSQEMLEIVPRMRAAGAGGGELDRLAGEEIVARWYVDTGPLPEKAWAEAAGLGWRAKNGNVISRRFGSWIFLAEILTNLDLLADRPHTAHCGTCTRCLEACPTGAIVAPYVVDANRCLAYHTIENRAETLPEAIVPQLQGWVAGCDICQEVCPWNERFAQVTAIEEFWPYPENVAPSLTELSQISDAEWDRRFRSSAFRRIRPAQLRRNARAQLPPESPPEGSNQDAIE